MKEYNELNSNINNYISYLKTHNSFFINNIDMMYVLSYLTNRIIKKTSAFPLKEACNVDSSDIYTTFTNVQKYMDGINPFYGKELEKLKNACKLEFNFNYSNNNSSDYKVIIRNQNDSIEYKCSNSTFEKSSFQNSDKIHIETKNNALDGAFLIHELYHSFAKCSEKNSSKYFLEEFIAIFMELQYLKQTNEGAYEADKINRLNYISMIAKVSPIIIKRVQIYKKIGKIDLNDFKYIMDNKIMTNENINMYNNNNIYVNKMLNEKNYIDQPFRYLFGYLLTTYIEENIDVNIDYLNKILNLCSTLKDKKIQVEDALKIIDIDITNPSFTGNVINSFRNNINDFLFELDKEKIRR